LGTLFPRTNRHLQAVAKLERRRVVHGSSVHYCFALYYREILVFWMHLHTPTVNLASPVPTRKLLLKNLNSTKAIKKMAPYLFLSNINELPSQPAHAKAAVKSKMKSPSPEPRYNHALFRPCQFHHGAQKDSIAPKQ
jgi:hypothetical protein